MNIKLTLFIVLFLVLCVLYASGAPKGGGSRNRPTPARRPRPTPSKNGGFRPKPNTPPSGGSRFKPTPSQLERKRQQEELRRKQQEELKRKQQKAQEDLKRKQQQDLLRKKQEAQQELKRKQQKAKEELEKKQQLDLKRKEQQAQEELRRKNQEAKKPRPTNYTIPSVITNTKKTPPANSTINNSNQKFVVGQRNSTVIRPKHEKPVGKQNTTITWPNKHFGSGGNQSNRTLSPVTPKPNPSQQQTTTKGSHPDGSQTKQQRPNPNSNEEIDNFVDDRDKHRPGIKQQRPSPTSNEEFDNFVEDEDNRRPGTKQQRPNPTSNEETDYFVDDKNKHRPGTSEIQDEDEDRSRQKPDSKRDHNNADPYVEDADDNINGRPINNGRGGSKVSGILDTLLSTQRPNINMGDEYDENGYNGHGGGGGGSHLSTLLNEVKNLVYTNQTNNGGGTLKNDTNLELEEGDSTEADSNIDDTTQIYDADSDIVVTTEIDDEVDDSDIGVTTEIPIDNTEGFIEADEEDDIVQKKTGNTTAKVSGNENARKRVKH